jgi:hypothetical protein
VEAVNGRLDGHDSTAAPLASEKWPDKATLGNPNADWEDVGSYDKVIEDMDKRGEGSRGVVYISRPNGTAHVFNVIHDRNGVVLMGSQVISANWKRMSAMSCTCPTSNCPAEQPIGLLK